MEQVRRHPGPLTLPVKPYPPCTVVKMILPDDHIYRRVELDAAYLGTRKIALVVYVVYMIVLDYREYAAKVPYMFDMVFSAPMPDVALQKIVKLF